MLVFTKEQRDFLVETSTDLDSFLAGFYRRHPKLRRYKPDVKLKSSGGTSGHGEARQHGKEIWIFPKFWKLDKATRDFVFAHELGHYFKSTKNPTRLMDLAKSVGVDVWDSSSLPFGQFDQEEAFAESFATYYINPSELKSRYPKWYLLVEMMLGKNVRVQPEGDFAALDKWADKVFDNLWKDHADSSSEEKAMFAATTIARQAKRIGFNFEGLSSWLQIAYGKIWVRRLNLNPGADLDKIRKVMRKSFEK